MFYFESLLKRKERAENLEVLPRLCHRARPWSPVLHLPGLLSPSSNEGMDNKVSETLSNSQILCVIAECIVIA